MLQMNPYILFKKNKSHFVDTLSRRTYFWDTGVQCGSEINMIFLSQTRFSSQH